MKIENIKMSCIKEKSKIAKLLVMSLLFGLMPLMQSCQELLNDVNYSQRDAWRKAQAEREAEIDRENKRLKEESPILELSFYDGTDWTIWRSVFPYEIIQYNYDGSLRPNYVSWDRVGAAGCSAWFEKGNCYGLALTDGDGIPAFKFIINNYTPPTYQELYQHRLNNQWFVYDGEVSYTVSNEDPTIRGLIEKRRLIICKNGRERYEKKTVKCKIKVQPYNLGSF